MLRRFVKFVFNKEEVTRVIDSLSAYGTIRVNSVKDGKTYSVSMYCKTDELQRCLDSILTLSRDGVWIRKLDVQYKV